MPRRKVVVVPTKGELTGIECDRIWQQIGDFGVALFGIQWKTRIGEMISPTGEGWTRARRMLDPAGEGAHGMWMRWLWSVYEDHAARVGEIADAAAAERARVIVQGLEILGRDRNYRTPMPVPFLPWDRPAKPPAARQLADELRARADARYADDDAQAAASGAA
jgi:hypothetical protein